MVNLFGHGFVGSNYAKQYPCIVNDRNDLTPKSNNILYLISTTNNFNVATNPYIDIETNLITLIRVLENCKHLKDVTFNFASSWFVYGGGHNLVETDRCDPVGFYSITKRTAEQLLQNYCEQFQIKYRILRFANVLGPNDQNVSAKKNALTYLTRKILNNEEIVLQQGGNFYRDYVHVRDLCDAINCVITRGEINSIYNIGPNEPILFKHAIEYIVDKTQSCSKITVSEQQVPMSVHINCDKLAGLGFVCKYSTFETIDEIIESEKAAWK